MHKDPIAKAQNEGRAQVDRWTLWEWVVAEAKRQSRFAGPLQEFEQERKKLFVSRPYSGSIWSLNDDQIERAVQQLADTVLASLGLRTHIAGRTWCTLVRQ
jgi:hypothetical protein